LVAALLRADRPGAADVAGLCAHCVVLAFARRDAYGMDGRQVQDIEAHFRDVRKPLDDVAERAVRPVAARRARKHLIPAREPHLDGVDYDFQGSLMTADS